MPCIVLTYTGLACLLSWLHAGCTALLGRDAAVLNGSLAASLAAAVPLVAVTALAGRARARSLQAPQSQMGICLSCALPACAAGALLAVSSLAPSPHARTVLFCAHACCAALALPAWGRVLGGREARETLAGACAASLGACAAASAFAALPLDGVRLATAAAAVASGVLLAASMRAGAHADEAPERDAHAADLPAACAADVPARGVRPSWEFAALLCAVTLGASLFGGMVQAPYLAVSRTMTDGATAVAAGGAAVVGIVLVGRGHARARDAENASGQEAHLETPLVSAVVGVPLALFLLGLFALSLQFPGSMTAAIAVAAGAGWFLTTMCWAFLPRIAHVGARLPFSGFVLASGIFYGPFAGAWASKTLGMGFDALAAASSALIIAVGACVVACLAARLRTGGILLARPAATAGGAPPSCDAEPAAPGGESAPRQPSLEDVREALRAHQQRVMEPYGLTNRERQIVTMLLDGQTMRGIAEQLFITERTVKFHSKNAYDKLGVNSKKELMQMFSELGDLPPDA